MYCVWLIEVDPSLRRCSGVFCHSLLAAVVIYAIL